MIIAALPVRRPAHVHESFSVSKPQKSGVIMRLFAIRMLAGRMAGAAAAIHFIVAAALNRA